MVPSSIDSRTKFKLYLYLLFNSFKTYAKTVESFPPDAAMATLLPDLNKLFSTIVLWTSNSNALKKHSLQSASPVLGR